MYYVCIDVVEIILPLQNNWTNVCIYIYIYMGGCVCMYMLILMSAYM